MGSVSSALRVGVIRAHKVETGQLIVRRITRPVQRHQIHHISKELVEKLRRELRRVRHSLHDVERAVKELRKEVRRDKLETEGQIHDLQQEVQTLQQALQALQAEIASGMPANSALASLFLSKTGQVVTVTTNLETVVGTVTNVAVNAVELTQSNGDIVIIPFSKITSIQ